MTVDRDIGIPERDPNPPDQLALAEPAVCPCCFDEWEPQLGDTDLCDRCFVSADRSEAAAVKVLGRDAPWRRHA